MVSAPKANAWFGRGDPILSALRAECRAHSMGGEKSEAPGRHSRLSLRNEHRGPSEEQMDKTPREPSMKDHTC